MENMTQHAIEKYMPSDDFFKDLYIRVFPAAAKFVSRKGGTLDQTKDLFQEPVIILYEQVLVPDKQIKQTVDGYLFGIVKHLWSRQYKSNNKNISLEDDFEAAMLEGDTPLLYTRVLRLVSVAGNRCMELLKAFYYDKLTTKQMADRYGFSNEHSATVQKFKCLEKVRTFVKEKAISYDDFVG